ncbi:MAG: hypothetical protein ACR2G8_05500 [Candidatus Limnocylindria bacterium]|nr:hypothetical protein [Chloroflexota bacterium]MDQ3400560.1 hypothetical protein [Chloroflexota bacterium]
MAPRPARPKPRRNTLTLLVGRVTTIKLAYWAAVTAVELALPLAIAGPLDARTPASVAAASLLGAGAIAWSVASARSIDRRLGGLYRSVPTIATAFVAASVVASPASVPLLLIERQRSLEGCAPAVTCHYGPILFWVAVLAIGMVLVPAAFALSMRSQEAA